MSRLTKKKQRDKPIFVATDSEWDDNRESPWLSTTFAITGKKPVTYVTDDTPEEVRGRMMEVAEGELVFRDRGEDTCLLPDAMRRLGCRGREVRLLNFVSAKDIEYAVGWTPLSEAILEKKVIHNNNISGRVDLPGCVVRVKDLKGWAGKNSLLGFTSSLGIDNTGKDAMDEYKSAMWDGLLAKPEVFLRYAEKDAVLLNDAHRAFVDYFGQIQRECLGMGDGDIWTADDIPMTLGSLVAKTLERWIHTQAPNPFLMKFCLRKVGILDPDARQHSSDVAAFHECRKRYRTRERLMEACEDEPPDALRRFMEARFLLTGLNACGVKSWAGRSITDSSCYNALVQGGRCNNESPFEYRIGRAADIDISGCYGESLRHMSYPLGLPTVWSWSPNDERITLGAWLDRHQKHLVPGLWTATVTGKLGFSQDLVFSKMVKARDIKKAALKDGDDRDINSNFALLRDEIVNGIINSDVLNILRAACTLSEWAGFRSLELVTAVAYLKKHRHDTIDSWCDAILKDSGEYHFTVNRKGVHVQEDARSRSWVPVPLEGFIGKMYDMRQRYKKLSKTAENPEERNRAEGLSNLLKLTVNVVYGDTSSRFFEVSNTVVANNITARARVGVWMTAKALGCRQTITDGGLYDPSRVAFCDPGRKPGLNSLSKMWDWHTTDRGRGRSYKPMNGWDWDGIPKPEQCAAMTDKQLEKFMAPHLERMNKPALDHVRSFWRNYGVEFPFVLEHKKVVQAASYLSKSDYAVREFNGEIKYTLRGKDKPGETRDEGQKLHPSITLLANIIHDKDDFPTDMEYTQKFLMKISKYRQVQSSHGYDDLKQLRPGDAYVQTRRARYNNVHFPLDTEAEFESRRQRRKQKRGKDVAWFEKYAPDGIDAVVANMAKNSLSEKPKNA